MTVRRAPSDAIVIGAGVIGCAVAYQLASRGVQVTVLETRDVGLGATQASAGVLAPYIEAHDGTALCELGARSLSLYDDFVRRVRDDLDRDIPYARTGTLEVTADPEETAVFRARAARPGPSGATFLEGDEVRRIEPHLAGDLLGGLQIPVHGYVAAGALTRGLAEAAAMRGASFSTNCLVSAVSESNGRVEVTGPSGTASADIVVLAAGSWSGQIGRGGAGLPVKPIRGQLLQLEWPGTPLGSVIWGPRCYLVPWPDGSVLVGATVEDAGFDERATVTGMHDLMEAACELAPRAWGAGFRAVRVGLRPATPDELPIVGPSRRVPGLVYATGHYRNGILLAPLTAQLVADHISGKSDPALDLMTPSRFGDL